jgi:hypothetical protein
MYASEAAATSSARSVRCLATLISPLFRRAIHLFIVVRVSQCKHQPPTPQENPRFTSFLCYDRVHGTARSEAAERARWPRAWRMRNSSRGARGTTSKRGNTTCPTHGGTRAPAPKARTRARPAPTSHRRPAHHPSRTNHVRDTTHTKGITQPCAKRSCSR